MKVHEMLFEYKRDITKNRLGDKLFVTAKKERVEDMRDEWSY